MESKNKMQWLIDRYNAKKMENLIAATGCKKGSIVIPTGGGKSGVVYEDIISHIDRMKSGEKVIFNLSAPILDLEAQFINDLFDVLKVIFADKVKNGEICFFINSTAEGDAYRSELILADVERFNDIEKFMRNPKASIAFVASCHKSLYKFAEKVGFLKSFAKVFCYLDESHLLINESRDDKKKSEMTDEEVEKNNSLEEIFSKSDFVYTLTATQSKYITELLWKYTHQDEHIVEVSARELIKNNIILPIKTYITRTDNHSKEDKITPEICATFMDMVKKDNPSIYHKMLITCSNSAHLERLQTALNEIGYKVFSTCVKSGTLANEDDEFESIDKVKFINTIDSYEGDCFVLHIKRLRQGIDIKSLTDCIFYNSTRVNDGVKRTILQTLGRVLRCANGERGMYYEDRTKKYGNALLIIGDDDFDAVSRQMINLLLGYYGRKGVEVFAEVDIPEGEEEPGKSGFTKHLGFKPMSFDTEDYIDKLIDTLKANLKEYVEVNLYKFWNRSEETPYKLGIIPTLKDFDDFVRERFEDVKSSMFTVDREIEMGNLLSDDELMDELNIVLKNCKEL